MFTTTFTHLWELVGGDWTTLFWVLLALRVSLTLLVDRTDTVRTWSVRLTL
ncbi:hypothetical protein ASL83_003349 [Vibrio parahaemolyticus]|nr:hypothetical protein [Vibrio parahaemolyticus]